MINVKQIKNPKLRKQIEDQIKKEKDIRNRTAPKVANVEQDTGNESMATKKIKGYDSPCCIHIHSIRKTLADADGISGKAAIDGIVDAGILKDDNAEIVKEVTFSQEKAKKAEPEY